MEPMPVPDDVRELARRVVPRDMIELLTLVRCADNVSVRARICDISPYGCQARGTGTAREKGDIVHILLPIIGEVEAHVMWGLKGLFGCKFETPIDADLYPQMLAMIRAEGEDWSDHRVPGLESPGDQPEASPPTA